MANTILHKKSSTPAATPTTGQLALGEIAVNTYDGKLFIKKNDGVEAVVEVGGGIAELVDDTSPTLGGTLESGGYGIVMADNNRVFLGTGNKASVYHTGTSFEMETGTGDLAIRNVNPDGLVEIFADNTSSIARRMLRIGPTGSNSVELALYWNSNVRLLTTQPGITVTGDMDVSGNVISHVGINAQTGTSYTMLIDDDGKLITMDNAAANTLTIPANASVAYPIGTQILITQLGAGTTSIAITTDTLVSAGGLTDLAGQYSSATLIKIAATTWLLAGDLA